MGIKDFKFKINFFFWRFATSHNANLPFFPTYLPNYLPIEKKISNNSVRRVFDFVNNDRFFVLKF
jgi:hypothetical protein